MNDRSIPQASSHMSDETGLYPYVLEATGVSKAFVQGGLNVQVLNNTQLSVRRGEKLAIVGASGSGKSTLLHLMGTLDRPTSGTVRVTGLDIARMGDRELSALRAARIGFVFQQFFLAEHQTVLGNVADGLLYAGIRRDQRRQLAAAALERVGLGHRATARPVQLSGGERQRVAIARAVAGAPPVVLLYGSVPAWRALAEGVTGADVSQLNHDLVALGDASNSEISALGWDYYSWETAYGGQRLEEHLGVSSPPGSLSLGQVVFEPAALRVATATGSLGGPASGPVLTATSDRHVVTIPLDASQQSAVKAGDTVSITLPDGTSTPGVVSSVGTVATTSGSGGSPTTTIPVQVKLTDPKAAGTLDQAPVTVNITTASVKNVLAVPVRALLARSPGGYVVEVAGPGNTRRWVPVRPGIFDDTSGLVQVTGALNPGQRVVVPAT